MTFRDAIGVLADATADADSKAQALKDALDALSGGQVSTEEIQGLHRDRTKDTPD